MQHIWLGTRGLECVSLGCTGRARGRVPHWLVADQLGFTRIESKLTWKCHMSQKDSLFPFLLLRPIHLFISRPRMSPVQSTELGP